jgi:hypothetical protein
MAKSQLRGQIPEYTVFFEAPERVPARYGKASIDGFLAGPDEPVPGATGFALFDDAAGTDKVFEVLVDGLT